MVESGGAEKDKADPALCTLHITLSINTLKTRNGAPSRCSTQSCEYFRPVAFFFVIRRMFVCRGDRSRRHNNNSKQQQSQPNLFAVTVIVVELGPSVCFISFPTAS